MAGLEMYEVICGSITRGKVFRKGAKLSKSFFGKEIDSYLKKGYIKKIEPKIEKPSKSK